MAHSVYDGLVTYFIRYVADLQVVRCLRWVELSTLVVSASLSRSRLQLIERSHFK